MYQAKILLKQGLSRQTVAGILGVSRRTVYNYENGVVFKTDHHPWRPRGSTKLSPFHAFINSKLEEDFTLNAELLLDKLRARGYEGKITILRDYISKKREEIYDGPFIDKYPDIVFELNEEYGIGNNIKCNVVEKNALHAVVPGSHKRYNAVLLMYNLNRSIVKTDVSLDDLAPTILSIIDLDYDDSIFDGHNIIAK